MKSHKSNRYYFGLGTFGRDMLYSMVSMYLLVYLTEILNLPDETMWVMSVLLTILGIFDALNDPLAGYLVDNTRSRFGKFKPWIVVGGLLGGVLTILLFTDFGLRGTWFIVCFAVIYLLWDITYGVNDIAYWSMLPALSGDQKEREKIGSFAKFCANLGMYIVVVAIIPVTNAMGGDTRAWFLFAVGVIVVTWVFLSFTVFGVREERAGSRKSETTSLKELVTVIFKNDQLLITAVSMILFMIGYVTTTSFGVYYFKYAYQNENMYSIFAGVLGISQLTAVSLFPLITRKLGRKRLYTGATGLVVVGYILFFLSPMNMLPIGLAGILIFIGQAFIQMLMLMFLADTVEYGQWKLGRRNESITFSIQPLINKLGGAVSKGIVLATLIVSGINSAETPRDVTSKGLLIMKLSMFILPLLFIVVGYLVYRAKFRIDETFYGQITSDLAARAEAGETRGEGRE